MTANAQTARGERDADPATLVAYRLDLATWAVLILGALLVLASAVQLAYRLTLPTDGWSFSSGAIGSELQDTITYDANLLGRPSPLRPGDFVLAVEGRPYHELLHNAAVLGSPLIADWGTRDEARYLVRRGDRSVELSVPLYRWQFQDLARLALTNAAGPARLLDLAIGLFVLLRRPREPAARLLFLLAVVWLTLFISDIVLWGLPEIIHPPVWLVAVIFSNWLYGGLAAPTVLLLALTFPRPKPFVQRHLLPLTIGVYSVLPLLLLLFGVQARFGWLWTAVCAALSLVSVVHTLWTTTDPVARLQLRWAGLGLSGLALGVLLAALGGFALFPPAVAGLLPLLDPLLQLAFPAALAVAILRYRLFAIDTIISRALVYGALTLCVVGLYIGVVTYLGVLLRSEDDLLASLIATGVITVVFQPLRATLQRAVDRLLFGQRDEPYRVIASLGQQLTSSQTPDAMFTTIVETIGQRLRLPFVAILAGDEIQPRVIFQQPAEPQRPPPINLLRLPLGYHEQAVGALLVSPRAGEPQFSAADTRLLHDLARQTGIAVYAAQLTADLRHSRERIVVAREEERRRLRRDLHDGLGPHLASSTLTLDVVARLLRSDPDRAAALLLAVREQMQQAVSDIRGLIDGLRPPVLDDLGLSGAVEAYAERVRQQQRARTPARSAGDDPEPAGCGGGGGISHRPGGAQQRRAPRGGWRLPGTPGARPRCGRGGWGDGSDPGDRGARRRERAARRAPCGDGAAVDARAVRGAGRAPAGGAGGRRGNQGARNAAA